MAESLGSMVVKLGADITDFQRNMTKAEKSLFKTGAAIESFGRNMTRRVSVPIVALGVAVTKFATDLDSLKRGLTAVTGSSSEAERQLVRLRQAAKLPGLGFEAAVKGSIRLQSLGQSAEFSERVLREFGNAVALTGGGAADLDRITVQLAQMAAKGKILSQDLRPIIEAAPTVGKALRDAFGTVDPEEISKLGLSMDDFFNRLMSQMERGPRAAAGARNSFDNLFESLKLGAGAIGTQLLPVTTRLADGISKWADGLSELNPNVVKWGISLAAVAALAGPLTTLTGVILKLGLAVRAIAVGAGGFAALAAIITPGGLLLAGLTAVAALFLKTKLDALDAAGAVDRYTNSIRGMSREQLLAARAEVLGQRDTLKGQISNLSGGRGNANRISNLQGQLGDRLGWFQEIEAALAALARPAEVVEGGFTEVGDAAAALAKRLDAAMSGRVAGSLRFDPNNLEGGGRFVGTPGEEALRAQARRAIGQGAASGLDLAMKTARTPVGPNFSGNAGGDGAIGNFVGALKSQVMGLVTNFGAVAAAAAVLKPVFEGFMETVGPALKALTEPLREIGGFIGDAITPLLKLLEEPLRLVAQLFAALMEPLRLSVYLFTAYLTPGLKIVGAVLEVVAKAFSYVTEAIGWFIKALGEFVDKIVPDWISKAGKGLAEMGQSMIDNAQAVRDGTRASTRATEAVDKFAASLNNVPNVVSIARLRHNLVSNGSGGGGSTSGTGSGSNGSGRIGHPVNPPVVIQTAHFHGVQDVGGLMDELGRFVERANSRGGTSRLQVVGT